MHRSKANGDQGRQKDKGGGDWRSPCSTTSSAAPPILVLLPTTRLGQISLLFFFFYLFIYFPYLLVLIQLYCKNWILFCVLCLDYVRRFLRVKQRDWNKDQTFSGSDQTFFDFFLVLFKFFTNGYFFSDRKLPFKALIFF